jgi:serine/threonine protein kinase
MNHHPFELPPIEALAALLPAFDFEHLIAQGGMGAVYKARQRSLDRDVAIKILPGEMGKDPVFRSSFQSEAKAMARLGHPNLIKVFDSGDVDGLLYIVMEYVPGKSLHHSAYGRAIDPEQAVEIIIAACHGLAHAHQHGIVHQDIKPANILLTPDRQPKIGDFGLARCTRSDASGPAMGTPGYMAPEIFAQPGKGSPQSDVFAIGVVLRELLTGIPAGSADTGKAVIADLKLAAICQKATHVAPAFRYSDASLLAGQLTSWLLAKKTVPRTLGTPAPPMFQRQSLAKAPARLASRPSSSKWLLVKNCAIIAFLACAIHLVWGVYQTKQETIARQQRQMDAAPAPKIVKVNPKRVARLDPANGQRSTVLVSANQ